jgi:hypothetical protein
MNLRNGIKYWVLFIVIEILIFTYYQNNFIQCEPCLPNTPCPPCISSDQVVSFWTGLIIALFFLIWQVIKLVKNKKE